MTTRNRLQKSLSLKEAYIDQSIDQKHLKKTCHRLCCFYGKKDVLKIENNRIAIFDLDTLLVW